MRLSGCRVVLLPFLIGVLSDCAGGDGQPPAYETTEVVRGDIRDIVMATGEIHQPIEMTVPIKADGQVSSLLVKLGERVRKGQLLATIQPRDAADDAVAAAADLADARIARAVASNRYDKATASHEGLRQLNARGFVPRARLLAESKELENERLGLVAAERKLDYLRQRAGRASSRQEERERLRSPCDCVVEDINIVPGQIVAPAMIDAFYLAGNGDTMTIRARLPEEDLGRAQQAGSVRFGVDAVPDETFPAQIAYISNRPVRDGRFVYYTIYLRFDRPNTSVRAGMTANVEFVNADSRDVLKVPVKALYFDPPDYVPLMPPFMKKSYDEARSDEDRRLAVAMGTGYEFGYLYRRGLRRVFVLQNGKPSRRFIRVSVEGEDSIGVSSGLAKGETVIVGRTRPSASPTP